MSTNGVYQAYTISSGGSLANPGLESLQAIGAQSTWSTRDHLVAAWQNSTDCSGGWNSRNAWVADSSGAVFGQSNFSGPRAGDFGSMAGKQLNQPVVGMTPTSDGSGYWLVASDGGVFCFGDAGFYGSTGNLTLNQPVEAMTATPDGGGYWLVASDGGVFSFGDAKFHGSMGGQALAAPIAGMIPNGSGYTLIGQNGFEYPFP